MVPWERSPQSTAHQICKLVASSRGAQQFASRQDVGRSDKPIYYTIEWAWSKYSSLYDSQPDGGIYPRTKTVRRMTEGMKVTLHTLLEVTDRMVISLGPEKVFIEDPRSGFSRGVRRSHTKISSVSGRVSRRCGAHSTSVNAVIQSCLSYLSTTETLVVDKLGDNIIACHQIVCR
ncbi:hypothetical protein RRG08_019849 [Elysia crispata]|uniref:Uncharacterized protein n=1 Tax=Elysia crispata TaxID=231223 RepID=A0AAE1DNA7_9GAST|nr:hypothetical protein RRG08_019849 [Elysia crispata]